MKDIISRSLCEHICALKKKEYSSYELTSAFIASVEAQDGEINAYITKTHELALSLAKESDKRRERGELLSSIDGIPYGLKDNISSEGIATTCASRMLRDYIPPYSAFAYKLLCESGAVLLGKTNMDEFAMGVSGETSYFGRTLNPLDKSRAAGGSSSGSAAAVAAAEAVFALGSDTGGSARQPAAFCGLVGMKPTYGAVSRYGLISFAPSLDTIAPITRTVEDNAVVLSVLAKKDNADSTCREHPCADFSEKLGMSLAGLRVCVLDTAAELSCEAYRGMEIAQKELLKLGAKIDHKRLLHEKAAYAAYYTISSAEACSNLARFDGVRYGYRADNAQDISELIARSRSEGFGREVKSRILFGTMALSSEYAGDFYSRAVSARNALTAELCSLLADFDVILLPTSPACAYKLNEAGGFERNTDDLLCTLASLSRLPAISIPVFNEGSLPVGVQLLGRELSESLLYSVAFALQKRMEGGENE